MTLRHWEAVTEVVSHCAAVIAGLKRGRVWATSSGRPMAHVWVMIWTKLEDLGLEPMRDFAVVKVKAHLKKKRKEQLAGDEKQLVVLNEFADAKAKDGCSGGRGPLQSKIITAKAALSKGKKALSMVAAFRVGLKKTKTTSLPEALPQSRASRQVRMRMAREARLRRLQEQQEQKVQHQWRDIPGGYICELCDRRCFSLKGQKRMQDEVPCVQRQQRVWAQLRGGRSVASASSGVGVGVGARDELGHVRAKAGPLEFCARCGLYASTVSRGLAQPCLGIPQGKQSREVGRRRKRNLLLQGKHPVTGASVEGITMVQRQQLRAWQEKDEE